MTLTAINLRGKQPSRLLIKADDCGCRYPGLKHFYESFCWILPTFSCISRPRGVLLHLKDAIVLTGWVSARDERQWYSAYLQQVSVLPDSILRNVDSPCQPFDRFHVILWLGTMGQTPQIQIAPRCLNGLSVLANQKLSASQAITASASDSRQDAIHIRLLLDKSYQQTN